VNGGLNNQSFAAAGVEANLDMQYTASTAFPIPITYFTTGGKPPFIPDSLTGLKNTNEPYLDFLTYLGALEDPPKVISTSYVVWFASRLGFVMGF
jgi:tripeptidyl-peptidase-1